MDESNKRRGVRSVNALLRQTERREKARTRKEAFQRRWKAEQEALLAENARLRRENVFTLKLLLHLTKRYERLSNYTETLRNWIASRTGQGKPTEGDNDA